MTSYVRGEKLQLYPFLTYTLDVDGLSYISPWPLLPLGKNPPSFVWKYSTKEKVKGKSIPLQAWRGPEGSMKLRFPDFMTTAQGGGKVASLTHRPHLLPGNSPGTHFFQRLSRPQGHSAIGTIMSMKIPMTPSGIEPATFRFVVQHLNHCATAVSSVIHTLE